METLSEHVSVSYDKLTGDTFLVVDHHDAVVETSNGQAIIRYGDGASVKLTRTGIVSVMRGERTYFYHRLSMKGASVVVSFARNTYRLHTAGESTVLALTYEKRKSLEDVLDGLAEYCTIPDVGRLKVKK